MAKRYDYKKRNEEMDKKLEKTIRRNWIICAVSLLVILILYFANQ